MVLVMMGLLSSEAGMYGNGKAVLDQSVEDARNGTPSPKGYISGIWGTTHVLAPSLLSQCSFPWPSCLHLLQACLKPKLSVVFLHSLIELKRLHISVLLPLLVIRFEVPHMWSYLTPSGMTMAE